MRDYKVCVYGICKNEEKFITRFLDSLEEIKDHIYLLDTGSTDKTVEMLKERGVHVAEKSYSKFTFDEARNDSLKLVPSNYDICICLDIDDVIEKGFLEKIKKNWQEDTTQMKYTYHYTLAENDRPVVSFLNNHIHKRDCYLWKYPIHEVLNYLGTDEKIVEIPELIVRHRPDCEKNRSFYLDLLEEFVKTHDEDSRNCFLLAREYCTRGEWKKCITTAHQYLKIPTATYSPERCELMTFLATSYRNLQYFEEAELWGLKAIEELNNTRDPYVELLITFYEEKLYDKAIEYGLKALEIDTYNKEVIDKASSWDGTIYDYISLAYYYLGDYDKAIEYIDKDILQNPNNERLKKNRDLFLKGKEEDIL